MALPSYLKVKDESVYYVGEGEFLLFVPETFFDRKVAIIEGIYTEVMGILNYSVNPPKNNLSKNLKTFYFPSKFITMPNRIEKIKDFAITKNYTADYRVLYYTNNGKDQIITSTKVVQDIENVEDLFRLFVNTGNIPNTIDYNTIYKYFYDAMTINGKGYNLHASIFGLLVSELCRDPEDVNKPFRLGTAIDKDECSYKPVSIKEVPKLVSPYTSLTSENFDKAAVGAIMNKNNGQSPLEKILVG